jgi:hypothetical protein
MVESVCIEEELKKVWDRLFADFYYTWFVNICL